MDCKADKFGFLGELFLARALTLHKQLPLHANKACQAYLAWVFLVVVLLMIMYVSRNAQECD